MDNLVHTRIVGGRVAQEHQFPFYVSLRDQGRERSFCGGSIISSHWVLTAAHCFKNESGYFRDPQAVEVVIGLNQLPDRSNNNLISENIIPVQKLVAFSKFMPQTFENDIVLLKTSGNLIKSTGIFSKAVRRARQEDGSFLGNHAIVMGHGEEWDGSGSGTKNLKFVDVKILDDYHCKSVHRYYNPLVQLCAGILSGGSDSCRGDSGSPLVAKTQQGMIQVGIVSYGRGCARPGLPSVYTKIAYFESFIQHTIDNY